MGYLDELNEVQQQAVVNTEGPVMVLAGAGSGKTRVLTYRIAHLIEKGIDPFNILALTFTNKAAREMKSRISTIVGETMAKSLWMGTFHSIFARILRHEAEKIGYPSNFTIYDTDDSKNLIKAIIKELNLDDKVYKPNLIQHRISSAKNNLIPAEKYQNDPVIYTEDTQSKKPLMGKIYGIYEKRCFKSGAMDFDDLLFKTNVLLRDHPDVLYKYQEKFRYLLVDEFQDTNFSQNNILRMLAARNENICVVGDDAQSIYAFRGANIGNILNFKKNYPDTQIFKLEQNYRSTQNIVNAANHIISKNKDQLKKDVWTQNEAGEKIKVVKCLSDNEEGAMVASHILDIKHHNSVQENAFAILYRTNAQSRAMEEALRKRNIPYKIYGGISFYQRKEIKDLLAYFRLSLNPNDEEAFKRVINYPTRGIGQTTLDKITIAASEEGKSLWEIVSNLASANLNINSGTANKLTEFVNMVRSFQMIADSHDAYEAGNHIASATGILKELYVDKTPEGVSRYENIQELLAGMKEFVETELTEEEQNLENPKSLAYFTRDIALLTDVDQKDQKDNQEPKVSLMTVHSAKGLEFPYVFIAGMEENLFPSQLSVNSRQELEEERRLFYVAITRAEKQAILSFATTRFRWGNLTYSEPSRFLAEIDPTLIDFPMPVRAENNLPPPQKNLSYQLQPNARRKLVKPGAGGGQASPDEMARLAIGTKVSHERFGSGEITNIEGTFPNKKATVRFEGVGEKQLLLKFAKLEILP